MKHFDSEAWILYRRGRLDEEQRRLMEDHLAVCDRCLHNYLALISGQEIHLAETLLPPDFNARVALIIGERKEEPHKKGRARSLFNYTVAAAITLVLMSSGMFNLCTREIAGIFAETGQISQALEKAACWDTDRMLENARARFEKLKER